MAADPLLNALAAFKKKMPKELQKGKTAACIPKLEACINKKDEKYESMIDQLLKGIAIDKKAAGKDKETLSQLEELEKVAKKDPTERLKGAKDKSTSPS